MGHFWASVHVGVRFKAQVHHHGDGPGLLGAAILNAVLLTEVQRAVSRTRRWMFIADKLSGDRLILASSTHGSLDSAPVPAGHLCFRLRSRLYDRPRGGVAQRLIDLAS